MVHERVWLSFPLALRVWATRTGLSCLQLLQGCCLRQTLLCLWLAYERGPRGERIDFQYVP